MWKVEGNFCQHPKRWQNNFDNALNRPWPTSATSPRTRKRRGWDVPGPCPSAHQIALDGAHCPPQTVEEEQTPGQQMAFQISHGGYRLHTSGLFDNLKRKLSNENNVNYFPCVEYSPLSENNPQRYVLLFQSGTWYSEFALSQIKPKWNSRTDVNDGINKE